MKILVTGGAGFLGKHVVNKLNKAGYDKVRVARSKEYDLRVPSQAKSLVSIYAPDVVIHLAATVGGIGANMANPGLYFYDNMMMGLNIIEQSRLAGVQKFIQVGTVCSYPKYCEVPFKENDLWNGYPEETNAPYGIAKKALYVMLQSYRQQYGLNSTILVPSNLYGPYDNFNPDSSHVIPALINKISYAVKNNIDSVSCWGSGNATREFLYVGDAAEAIVKSVSVDTDGSPINLGCGQDISIRDLVQTICSVMGYRGSVVWDSSKPDGQPKRMLDVTRSKDQLNWEASTSLDDGLKETLRWYSNAY